jgi:hypothetical protein
MPLDSGVVNSAASLPHLPDEERARQVYAELQLAELQQALAAAQAQVAFQNNRYRALLEKLPPGSNPPSPSGQVLRYPAYNPDAELLPAAPAALASSASQMPLLTRLLEQNPNPVLLLTATGETRYANAAAKALGPALRHKSQPNSYLLPLVRKALRTGTTQQQEIALADRWYLLQAVPGPGETCATLYLTDCTSVYCAEQRLAEQREFYETILHELPIDVAALDAEHRYRFVNASEVKDPVMREWVVGKTNQAACIHRQLPEELAAERDRHFDLAVQQGTEVQWEELMLTPTGTQRILRQLRPVYGPDGELRLLVSMGLNVTERYQAEKQLVEQRAFYEFIFNQLPCDIGIFDSQFRYLFVNERGISDPATRHGRSAPHPLRAGRARAPAYHLCRELYAPRWHAPPDALFAAGLSSRWLALPHPRLWARHYGAGAGRAGAYPGQAGGRRVGARERDFPG